MKKELSVGAYIFVCLLITFMLGLCGATALFIIDYKDIDDGGWECIEYEERIGECPEAWSCSRNIAYVERNCVREAWVRKTK